MAKIGFIGLGIMGSPMALNVQHGGHQLFLNGARSVPQALIDGGAQVCAKPTSSSSWCQIRLTWRRSCSMPMA